MRVKILKSFPFYPDGNTKHDAVEGTVQEIPDALVRGLSAAGYVDSSTAPERPKLKSVKEEVAPVESPPPAEHGETAAARPVAPASKPIAPPPRAEVSSVPPSTRGK
jgi:hypothetical protein